MFGWIWELIRRIIRRLSGCGSASVSIAPTSGMGGTTVIITITGLKARDPVWVTIGPGTQTTPGADANGNATVTEIIHGEPGEVVPIHVFTGIGICEEQTTVNFTVTS